MLIAICDHILDENVARPPMPNGKKRKLLTDVGRRIRAKRKEQGLSLRELSLLTGISSPALSLIETAKRDVQLTTLAKIASALRARPSAFLEDEAAGKSDRTADPSAGYDIRDYL